MTTGFCLWCQLAFSTYLENATQPHLNNDLQQQLLSGEILGATGLSNPMKSFNDLEKLNLEHTYVDGQLVVSGRMPAVSNIQEDHYLVRFRSMNHQMNLSCSFYVPIKMVSRLLKNKFLGVNGSATYQITLNQVVVPQSQIITHDAKQFAATIRPQFIAYQIPIGLGSIKSSLELIDAFSNAQNGINQYLEYDVEGFKKRYRQLREEYYAILDDGNLTSHLNELISLKKDIGYLLLDVNQASVVNGGSRAYTPYSPQVRKLKEGFFFAALTPTLRHLGKLEAELKG